VQKQQTDVLLFSSRRPAVLNTRSLAIAAEEAGLHKDDKQSGKDWPLFEPKISHVCVSADFHIHIITHLLHTKH